MHHSEIPAAQSLQEQFKQAVINHDSNALQGVLSATAGDALPLDINALCCAQGNRCYSALVYASAKGYTEIVKALIEAGVDVDAKDN